MKLTKCQIEERELIVFGKRMRDEEFYD